MADALALAKSWQSMSASDEHDFQADGVVQALVEEVERLRHDKETYRASLLLDRNRAETVEGALRLILPMAEGYARLHGVGNNRAMVEQARATLPASEGGGA